MRCSRVPGERLGAIGPMLLIERRVVLLPVHGRSQVLGADTIQHALLSRRTLQRVVVNRADVTAVKTAMIHTGLAEMADRRSTLHLTTEVRRTLMHLVLSATKISDMAASETTTTHVTATHVATTGMTAATSTVAVAGRQALKTEH